MTPEELSYIERIVKRQTLITDLIMNDVNPEFLEAILPDKRCTTKALEDLLAGIIKLNMHHKGVDID